MITGYGRVLLLSWCKLRCGANDLLNLNPCTKDLGTGGTQQSSSFSLSISIICADKRQARRLQVRGNYCQSCRVCPEKSRRCARDRKRRPRPPPERYQTLLNHPMEHTLQGKSGDGVRQFGGLSWFTAPLSPQCCAALLDSFLQFLTRAAMIYRHPIGVMQSAFCASARLHLEQTAF